MTWSLPVWAAALMAATILAATPATEPAAPARSLRLAFVPLDDRPANLQYPLLLADVADAGVAVPPRALLGRHLKTGDGDAIARWLDQLDLSTLDAVVVSADMLAYGGLIGSRVPRVLESDARARLAALGRLKSRRSNLPVYVFGSILRLAPTDDGSNRVWRDKVARWAAIATETTRDPALAAEAAAIEGALPAGMLDRYRETRRRNRAIDVSLIDLVAAGAIDYLLIAADDATPGGMARADQREIARAIESKSLGSKVTVAYGPDEAACLVLTRALLARFNERPSVQVVYSSAEAADRPIASEGRSVKEAVASSLAASGARVESRASLQLFVYASRHEEPDRAEGLAATIAKTVTSGGRVALADIDPAADGFGAWLPLVEGLRTRKVLPHLASFAAAPSAGTSLTSAIAHGLIFDLAVDRIAPASPGVGQRIAAAQVALLLHRLMDDFLYQGVVRGQAIESFAGPRGFNPSKLDESGTARLEKHLAGEIKPLAESLTADFAAEAWRLPAPAGRRSSVALTVKDIDQFAVGLPWNRLSEVELGFTLLSQPLAATARPPGPRLLK